MPLLAAASDGHADRHMYSDVTSSVLHRLPPNRREEQLCLCNLSGFAPTVALADHPIAIALPRQALTVKLG